MGGTEKIKGNRGYASRLVDCKLVDACVLIFD